MERYITHNGKKFEIKEPTIQNYANVMKLRDLLNDQELYVKLICELTELRREEVIEASIDDINKVGEVINKFFSNSNKEIFYEIEYRGIKYNLVDVYKISFGQFVDIDTFLTKDEAYKLNNLNELASYLYLEKGKTYSEIDFRKQKEIFSELPMKYLEGAIFFLVNLGLILAPLTEIYSRSKFLWMILKLTLLFQLTGDGIPPYPISVKTKFGKFLKLLTYPLWLALIILPTSLMWLKRKIKSKRANK
jgi:hypothetical protein